MTLDPFYQKDPIEYTDTELLHVHDAWADSSGPEGQRRWQALHDEIVVRFRASVNDTPQK